MTRPNITPGDWTLEPAMDKEDCGLRIHTPESAAYGMARIYSPGANAEANAVAMTAVPALLEALERWHEAGQHIADALHAAGYHPDFFNRIQDAGQVALTRAGYSFP